MNYHHECTVMALHFIPLHFACYGNFLWRFVKLEEIHTFIADLYVNQINKNMQMQDLTNFT